MDLFVTSLTGDNLLLHNNGDGTFSQVSNAGDLLTSKRPSWSSAWADYDNDGYLDLFVTHHYTNPNTQFAQKNSLYHNNGDGTFSSTLFPAFNSTAAESWASTTCAWGDIENDGDPDLIVVGLDAYPMIYANRGNCNHWLKLKLVGVISNRSAIGTKVSAYVTLDGKPQIITREVSGQTGYRSQNTLEVMLGFKNLESVDSILLNWPSGIHQVLRNIGVDRRIVV